MINYGILRSLDTSFFPSFLGTICARAHHKRQTWRALTEDRRCTMNRSNAPSQHAIRQTAKQPPDLHAPPKRTDQAAAQRTADRPQENLRGVSPIPMGSQSIGSNLEGAEPSSRAEVLANPRPSKRRRADSKKKSSKSARWTAIKWTIEKVREIAPTLEPMERKDRVKYVQEQVFTCLPSILLAL